MARPSSRRLGLGVAVLIVVLATAAAAQAGTPRSASPTVAAVARAQAYIPDATLRDRTLQAAPAPGPSWGGEYTVATAEKLTVYVSSSYPEDPAVGQRWADFLASLVHGSELSDITVYLTTLGEVGRFCGTGALACYSPGRSLIVGPLEDPAPDLSAEAVITHEYGHHVASARSNPPWVALDYGTKRWASYVNVCANARSGKLFPGAEDGANYKLNPGEAFAEAYRVLNERKAGLPEPPWDVVSNMLYPDDAALGLLEQDVTTPWTAAVTTSVTGSVTKRARIRNYSVATQLDGTLQISLRPPAKTRLALDVYAGSARIAHAAGARALSATTSICGQRSIRIKVTRLSGKGTFRLSYAKP